MPQLNKIKTIKKLLETENVIVFYGDETNANVSAEGKKSLISKSIKGVMVNSEPIRKIVLSAIDSAFESISKFKREEDEI